MALDKKKLFSSALIIGGFLVLVASNTDNAINKDIPPPEEEESFGIEEAPATQIRDNVSEKVSTLLATVQSLETQQELQVDKLSDMEVKQESFINNVNDKLDEQHKKNTRLINETVNDRFNQLMETLPNEVANLVPANTNNQNEFEQSSDEAIETELGINNSSPRNAFEEMGENFDFPVLVRPKNAGNGKELDQDLEKALGKPASKAPVERQPKNNKKAVDYSVQNIVWYEADDIIYQYDENGNVLSKSYPLEFDSNGIARSSAWTDSTPSTTTGENGELNLPEAENTLVPILTVPQNSTLMGARATTAIVGRVPTDGTAQNSYRYKVSVGAENMASNGFYIPGLESMIMSGYAEGDFTMECARGDIDTLTYTFQDGTIRTIGKQGGDILGWISDRFGNPCIPGYYISNFPEFAATNAGIAGLVAFGEGMAASQTTTVTGDNGTQTQIIDGDTVSYAAGKMIGEAGNTTSEFYAKRQEDAFDAVWLEVGEHVAVHIEKELHIDYDTKGRKIIHSENIEEYLN